MNKKIRKHNIKIYTQSVENARKTGGYYVIEMSGGKEQQYLMDLANEKMKRKNKA